MKRVFILCLLIVVCFGNVEAAKAEQMVFGAATLDDQVDLLTNLRSLLPEGAAPGAFTHAEGFMAESVDPAYIALIGVSQAAMSDSRQTTFTVYGNPFFVAEASEMTQYWPPSDQPQALEDVFLGWNQPGMSFVPLLDILDDQVDGVSIAGAWLYASELVYQPVGFDAVVFAGGTIFVGFDLGFGNEVDAILAFSPAPINAVPVPAAVWLLGTGLAGIAALRRRVK